jgi:Na+-transporting NADH:ubiquinone oxidoreductase subunit NqrF
VRIIIVGNASKTRKAISVTPEDLKQNLLKWLRQNQVTIASSCDGEGVCKKCVIQNDWLTCQMTVEDFLHYQPDGQIFVGYL